ncbi:MAG TPA: class I SAM-dependent methyltransferase [Vicinamibacterales bacterium]|nr:class I SAM-dependent methyltransferase [Vicinamibacterales bacterium]
MQRRRDPHPTAEEDEPSTPDDLAAAGVILEDAACAFCGTPGGERVIVGRDRALDRPGRFQVVRCPRCDLLRTHPRPTLESIGVYYPSEYAPYQPPPARTRWGQSLREHMNARWTYLPRLPPGRLLELGPAIGLYMQAMQRAGWDVTGIELSTSAAHVAAAATGAPVHVGDVCGITLPPASFDVVSAWMVLEHLHDPVAALRRAFEWLKPGGWLGLSVPDAGSWMFRAFGNAWFCLELPRHLYHFSVPTLSRVLESCGFRDVVVMRPWTTYDLAYSIAARLDDRRWVSSRTSARWISSLPARAALWGAGWIAGGMGLPSMIIVNARKPLA